jgi:hypothetical protein
MTSPLRPADAARGSIMRGYPFLLCLALAACGPSTPAERDAASPDAASTGDASIPIDADLGLDSALAPDTGTDDGGAPNDFSGAVSITQTGTGHSASGIFSREVPIDRLLIGALSPLCTDVLVEGACRVVECPAPAAFESAGTLTATVNDVEVASLTPGSGNTYLRTDATTVFAAGDSVEFAATGDTVPAFTLATTAPAPPTITFPTTIARTAPLSLSWSGARAERFQIVLSSGARVLVCLGEDTGSVSVPPALLGELAASTTAFLGLTVFNQAVVTEGEWTIAATAAEGRTTGPVTLE